MFLRPLKKSSKRFKAILNHFGVILGPFVDPLGTILGLFWGYLGQFEAILSHFGSHLEAPTIAVMSAGVVFRENSRF